MPETFDCIVLGVGGFGSGALYHLARRGARVLGIEQYGVAHDRGSSHGETRIIRKAYFEHPDYVPLLLRAYDLWRELEAESGRDLMRLRGLMLAGLPEGEAIAGARLSARQHGLQIEDLTATDAAARWPGFRFPEEFAVVFEADAGYLAVEECVRTHVERAVARGAVVRTGETVTGWTDDGRTVRVTTDRGKYESLRLVVAAGAWAGRLLRDLSVPLSVVRKPVFWHSSPTADYDASRGTPAFYLDTPEGAFYGFPRLDGQTVKVAEHTGGDAVQDPGRLDRVTTDADHSRVRAFVERMMPQLDPRPVRSSVCMYTLTPDRHFLIDRHPRHPNVVFGAGFSGHGFKFTSVLGAALAELALDGRTELPVQFLSVSRFR